MTSTINPSAMIADALAQFSKAVYSAFTEIENQSRLEVHRAVSETREARKETREARTGCDEARKETREVTLEAQGWKQALGQAELTIAHQAENLESQYRTIAELQQEISRWKDQSRNWEGHFLRVERERCSLSSRNDELMKRQRQRDVPFANPSEEASQTSAVLPHLNLSSSKRKTKANESATRSSQQDPQTPIASCSTLIRRVQAVIHVKREESDDDSVEDSSVAASILKDDALDGSENVGANKRRFSRRSRKIIGDDDDIEQHDFAADGIPVLESRHLRHRSAVVNYREEEDDDDDELMLGAEENHDEVYGTQRVETLDAQRSKQQQPHPTNPSSFTAPPLKKRRKVAAR